MLQRLLGEFAWLYLDLRGIATVHREPDGQRQGIAGVSVLLNDGFSS